MAVHLSVKVWKRGKTVSLVADGHSAHKDQAPDLVVDIPETSEGYRQVMRLVEADERPPAQIDADKQSTALEHVTYEIDMCAWTALQVASLESGSAQPHTEEPPERSAMRNALLESHLVHLRALTTFLLQGKAFATDVTHDQLVPGSWSARPAEAVQRLRTRQPRVNRRLGHLTWDRVDEDPVKWAVVDDAIDVLRVARAWLDHAAEEAPALAVTPLSEVVDKWLDVLQAVQRLADSQVAGR